MEFSFLLLIAPAICASPFRTLYQREMRFIHSFSSVTASSTDLDNSRTRSHEPAEISSYCCTQCKSEMWFEATAINSYPYFSEGILLRKNRGVALFFLLILILRASECCDRASEACRNSRTTNYRYGAPAHD
jgi:hypothetical protein